MEDIDYEEEISTQNSKENNQSLGPILGIFFFHMIFKFLYFSNI